LEKERRRQREIFLLKYNGHTNSKAYYPVHACCRQYISRLFPVSFRIFRPDTAGDKSFLLLSGLDISPDMPLKPVFYHLLGAYAPVEMPADRNMRLCVMLASLPQLLPLSLPLARSERERNKNT
jgi:hypothetical protein